MKLATWFLAALLAPAAEARAAPPVAGQVQPQDKVLQQCLAQSIGPFAQDRCHDRQVELQEARLDRALLATRRYLASREQQTSGPEAPAMEDRRRDPAYLDRSQAAWRDFVQQNCTLQAGLLWGANVWVSRGVRSCYLEELERRIRFLESIASGEFTAR